LIRRPTWLFPLVLVAACNGAGPVDTPSAGTPWFAEVAAERGLDFEYRSGHGERYLFPEIIGGGAALFDADGDGDLDVYFVQSGEVTLPGAAGAANRLYLNDGRGRFEEAGPGAGASDRGYGMGAATADYDADGDTDLFVTNLGRDTLLRNDGARFVDVTAAAGLGDEGWGTGAVFFDADGDGDLDLFVARYVDWTLDRELECHDPRWLRDYCLPTNYDAPAHDLLYMNDGDGSFTEVSERAGLLSAYGNGLGVVAADFDGDGDTDVFVANDATMNQLWINQGDGTFVDEALLRGCAIDEQGMTKAGMGVVGEDLDGDADPDLLVVNLQHQTDSFYRNDGGFFTDATGAAGLATASRRFTRFGVGAVDLDNDGRLDLFVAQGRVMKSPEPPAAEDPYAEPNLLLRGDGAGRWVEVSPPGGAPGVPPATSRAAVFGDVDGDGGVDVLVVNRDAPAHLFRNVHPSRGHWIRLRVPDAHGADALGAVLTVHAGNRSWRREVRTAYGYLAANDPTVHVGLGEATRVDRVEVTYRDGTSRSFGPFEADRLVELR
jgi:hypothetical protein